MIKRIALALALMTSPAIAKDITLTLTDQEQQQMVALLDLAAKQGGINAAAAVAYFANKIRTLTNEQQPAIHPPMPPEQKQR